MHIEEYIYTRSLKPKINTTSYTTFTQPVLTGGGLNEFRSVKNALEIVAEPKHDFSGKERSIVYNTINNKYNGSVIGESLSKSDISIINNIIHTNNNSFYSTDF